MSEQPAENLAQGAPGSGPHPIYDELARDWDPLAPEPKAEA